MIYRCEFYFLDCGRKFVFCPVKITAPETTIPANLLNLLSPASLGYCSLPVTVVPRRANLIMTNREIFSIEYPFASFMPDWANFWQQLEQNPEIAILQNIGESISDSLLRSYLL